MMTDDGQGRRVPLLLDTPDQAKTTLAQVSSGTLLDTQPHCHATTLPRYGTATLGLSASYGTAMLCHCHATALG